MISERKLEWAENLSAELKGWVPAHGYRASTELADELSIPRGTWSHIYQGSAILAGEGRDKKFDGRIFYARIHLWTDLAASDPRNIPDRLITLPKGGMTIKKRSLPEKEYQLWLKSPEAQEFLAKKKERFQRETIMMAEFSTTQPAPSETTAPSETAGSYLGSFVDNLIERGADQVARLLLERQPIMFDLSDLEARITSLEGVIAKLVIQAAAQASGSRQRSLSASRAENNDISQVANNLRELLIRYQSGISEERDELMKVHGKDLMALDILVHTLTRRKIEREESIDLTKEVHL